MSLDEAPVEDYGAIVLDEAIKAFLNKDMEALKQLLEKVLEKKRSLHPDRGNELIIAPENEVLAYKTGLLTAVIDLVYRLELLLLKDPGYEIIMKGKVEEVKAELYKKVTERTRYIT